VTTDNFEDVGNFHRKFGLHYVGAAGEGWLAGPQAEDPHLLEFRAKFLCEELEEFLNGMGIRLSISLWDAVQHHIITDVDPQSDAQMADALVDLVYVALGTAHLRGYPWPELWDDVQRANMEKQRATGDDDALSVRKSKFDVVKPPGWQPPHTREIMREHGFDA
jgi:predicted HAD superfamily Cof-like phosphohydrolase